MLATSFICILLLVCFANAQFNCDNLTCDPCAVEGSIPKVDFVFIIDLSGSMKEPIRGVLQGLTKMAQEISARDLSATYTIIGQTHSCGNADYGDPCMYDDPEVMYNVGSNSSRVIELFGLMNPPYYVPGIHQARDPVKGSLYENSFEPMLMTLDKAGWPDGEYGYDSFDSRVYNCIGNHVQLRADARPVFIVITNEVEDTPRYASNRPSSMTCGEFSQLDGEPTSSWYQYQDFVASQLIAAEAFVYFFIYCPNSGWRCNYNYGALSHQVQLQDYSGFDSQATLQALQSNGYGKSMQAQLLAANLTSRTFSLQSIDPATNGSATVASNIMAALVAEVAACDSSTARRRRKRSTLGESMKRMTRAEPVCIEHRCDPAIGCYSTYKCLDLEACNNCLIGSSCVQGGAQNAANPQQFCNPSVSKTQWTTCGDYNASACAYSVYDEATTTCKWSEPVCTAACGRCKIDGSCLTKLAKQTNNECNVCDPDQSATSWTVVCSCNAQCTLNGGRCTQPTGVCDCSQKAGYGGEFCDESLCSPACEAPTVCVAGNCVSGGNDDKTQNTEPTGGGANSSSNDKSDNTTLIVAIVASIVGVIVIVAAIVVVFVARSRRQAAYAGGGFGGSGRKMSSRRPGRSGRESHHTSGRWRSDTDYI